MNSKRLIVKQVSSATYQFQSDEFDYHDFEKGFEKMNGGKSGKIILNWA